MDKRNLLLGELEISNESYAFFQTSKDCIFTTKGVLPKIQIKPEANYELTNRNFSNK